MCFIWLLGVSRLHRTRSICRNSCHAGSCTAMWAGNHWPVTELSQNHNGCGVSWPTAAQYERVIPGFERQAVVCQLLQ